MATTIAPGYEMIRAIGQGGMGNVFLARARDGREVAIKVLSKLEPAARERFAREVRLLSEFGRSEGFVPLLDSGDGPNGPFLVMPFASGGTLRARLEKGPLAIEDVVVLGRAVGAALGRAHARGIVHRDLKPENCLFGAEGEPLLADLGLAKHFSTDGTTASVRLSRTGDVRGTVGYMPPEQMRDAAHVTPAADVFALGAILHECLTGVPLFQGATVLDVVASVESGRVESPRRARPETPPWLDAAIVRALAYDPLARFEDGSALVRALSPAPSSRRRWPLVIVGAAVLASVALLVSRRSQTPPVTPPPPAPTAGPPAWFLALPVERRPSKAVLAQLDPLETPDHYRNKRDLSELIFVPAGRFLMGAEEWNDDEGPRHEVRLSAFLVGKYETTVRQWRAYAQATKTKTVAETKGGFLGNHAFDGLEYVAARNATWKQPQGDGVPADDDSPVVQITRREAIAYAEYFGLRLPTEAEWERAACWDAARGEARRYPWGNDDDPALRNASGFVAGARPHMEKVGLRPLGASPVGALDMAGNASELVFDTYDQNAYKEHGKDAVDPCHVGANEPAVSRGGGYKDGLNTLRTRDRHAVRDDHVPNDMAGFRVALSADGSPRPRGE